jgi:hypothetical protein
MSSTGFGSSAGKVFIFRGFLLFIREEERGLREIQAKKRSKCRTLRKGSTGEYLRLINFY